MRVALVSREVHPYVGGGIAPIVTAAARLLSTVAEVTVVTSAEHRAEHERLSAAGDPRVLPREVRLVWVTPPERERGSGYLSDMHAYSAGVDAALRAAYPDGAPDLIEFPDYLGEGFVTVQARHTSDPWLERSLVCVRLHTTAEMAAVLDGHVTDDFETRAVHDAERFALRHADRLLWPGGDVLDTYRRFYGDMPLAPAERIPDAFLAEGEAAAAPHEGGTARRERADGDPLELLYLGRLERRKGVQNLVRAVTATARRDLRLTLLGADTHTAPLRTSLRAQLELMAGGDERIRFLEPVPRGEVARHVESSDVVVVPSLWECWPNVAREAFMHNRPVLATPVGGLAEMVVPERSGWLASDTSAEALRAAIERLDPGTVGAVIDAGGPRARFEELTDPDALVRRYRDLVSSGRPGPPRRREPELVSVVIPYFHLERYVRETIASVRAQTYPRVEIVLVNDGSLREEDAFLYDGTLGDVRVVTQPNSGLSASRNLGIAIARGRYVLPLDADDLLEPEFLDRCVRALERDPDLAYVTTWVQYLDPDGNPLPDRPAGYTPLGNWSRLMERNNVAGTCAAVFRRHLFGDGFAYSPDLVSYEDWLLYYDLHRAGRYGGVIPERLFRYRVRPDSMMRTDGRPETGTIFDEIRAHVRENEVRWVASG